MSDTSYVVGQNERSLHIATSDGNSACSHSGVYQPASEAQIARLDVCYYCQQRYNPPLRAAVLEHTADQWLKNREIAERIGRDASSVQAWSKRLHDEGEINRRPARDGRGYEFSQQAIETPTAGYNGDDNLFESMLD